MAKSPKPPPSNSDALAFSKKDQLGRSGPVPDRADAPFSKKQQAAATPSRPPAADQPFSKQQQMGKSPGAMRSTPKTITRPRPSLPDADLPFSKTHQIGKATGRKTRPAR